MFTTASHLITPPSTTLASSIHEKSSTDVAKYVSKSSRLILSLWQVTPCPNYESYVKEVLKRSRCSLPMLQFAIYYVFKLKRKMAKSEPSKIDCPKKVFLISLILAFKFQYDSNYSFKSWSKISGLSIKELQHIEVDALKLLNYELNVKFETFNSWLKFLNATISAEPELEVNSSSKRSLTSGEFSITTKRIKVSS